MPVCCQAVMESAGMDSPDMIKINISNNVNNFWDGIFIRQSLKSSQWVSKQLTRPGNDQTQVW